MAPLWIILSVFIFIHMYAGELVNVALRKPVNMSSRASINKYPPEKAVDGNTDAVMPEIIYTAIYKSSAWWWVDLQKQVQYPTVRVYFRKDLKRRRNGVQLYTSTTPFSTYPAGMLCHNVTGNPNGTDVPDVVSVKCAGTWRYLLIYKGISNWADYGSRLDFGEVEVLVCSAGTYDLNCTKSCSSRQCAVLPTACDRYTGACPPGGCNAGWMGTDCTTGCSSGVYGINCVKRCSSRHCILPSGTCNRFTGACPGGCMAGLWGTDCTEGCTSGVYGINCIKRCSSRHCIVPLGTCNRFTGECPGGCMVGWRGTDCTEACASGTYGRNCNMACENRNCKSYLSCARTTGQCDNGCQPGWNNTDCTQKCPAGSYGDICSKLCRDRHCLTPLDTCDHVNGACPGSKCEPGWMGTGCTQACPSGRNCSSRCGICDGDNICDHVTGNCVGGSKSRSQEIASTGSDGSTPVIAGVIGGLVGIIVTMTVVCVACVCLIRQGSLMWMMSKSKAPEQPVEMANSRIRETQSSTLSVSVQSDTARAHNDYSVLDGRDMSHNKDYEIIQHDYQNK